MPAAENFIADVVPAASAELAVRLITPPLPNPVPIIVPPLAVRFISPLIPPKPGSAVMLISPLLPFLAVTLWNEFVKTSIPPSTVVEMPVVPVLIYLCADMFKSEAAAEEVVILETKNELVYRSTKVETVDAAGITWGKVAPLMLENVPAPPSMTEEEMLEKSPDSACITEEEMLEIACIVEKAVKVTVDMS